MRGMFAGVRYATGKIKSKAVRILVRGSKKVLRAQGYRVNILTAKDLISETNDPRLAGHYGRPVIAEMPLESARAKILPFAYGPQQPFVAALMAGTRRGEGVDLGEVSRVLAAFYELVQPADPAEWMGLCRGSVLFPAEGSPSEMCNTLWPWATGIWGVDGIGQAMRGYPGKGSGAIATEGCQHFGPVSLWKREVEAGRLCHVWQSIRSKGYRYDTGPDGCIRAELLINGQEETRWRVCRGHHRLAAAVALGYRRVPVCITNVVERKHVELWPRIFSGKFTREQALCAFDTVFEARPLPLARPWLQWLQKEASPIGSPGGPSQAAVL